MAARALAGAEKNAEIRKQTIVFVDESGLSERPQRYRTGRQAKRGQQNYCPACGRKAGWRYAANRQHRNGRRRQAKRRISTFHVDATERASRVLALANTLGPPPRGSGAGAYWRRFHARARALKLVNGRRPVASQMAYLRARRRLAG